MQCPFHQDIRAYMYMFKDIESLFDGREQAFIEHGYFILSMLVGATIPGFSFESMIEIYGRSPVLTLVRCMSPD